MVLNRQKIYFFLDHFDFVNYFWFNGIMKFIGVLFFSSISSGSKNSSRNRYSRNRYSRNISVMILNTVRITIIAPPTLKFINYQKKVKENQWAITKNLHKPNIFCSRKKKISSHSKPCHFCSKKLHTSFD